MTRVVGHRIGFPMFEKTSAFKDWRKHAAGVVQFIDETFPGERTVCILSLKSLLLSVLADDLKNRNVPVTLGTISSNLGRLPEMLDVAFPGYIKSGLAPLIMKAMGTPHDNG